MSVNGWPDPPNTAPQLFNIGLPLEWAIPEPVDGYRMRQFNATRFGSSVIHTDPDRHATSNVNRTVIFGGSCPPPNLNWNVERKNWRDGMWFNFDSVPSAENITWLGRDKDGTFHTFQGLPPGTIFERVQTHIPAELVCGIVFAADPSLFHIPDAHINWALGEYGVVASFNHQWIGPGDGSGFEPGASTVEFDFIINDPLPTGWQLSESFVSGADAQAWYDENCNIHREILSGVPLVDRIITVFRIYVPQTLRTLVDLDVLADVGITPIVEEEEPEQMAEMVFVNPVAKIRRANNRFFGDRYVTRKTV